MEFVGFALHSSNTVKFKKTKITSQISVRNRPKNKKCDTRRIRSTSYRDALKFEFCERIMLSKFPTSNEIFDKYRMHAVIEVSCFAQLKKGNYREELKLQNVTKRNCSIFLRLHNVECVSKCIKTR